ncbi:MAG: flagellin, partial [Paracoccaceae bacterium]|nr:flagellin [Paracoccaceae bacterium]
VISALNTRVGDRSLFAGQGTEGPAVADAQTILASLDIAIAGAQSADDVQIAVSDWFDSPTGYAAAAYLGSTALAPLSIAQGEAVTIDFTAADPEIRDTLKGLAMAALLDRGALNGSPAARADLARLAGESLLTSQTGRADMAARLGIAEGQIEAAKIRNGAETSALQIARNGIISADPFEAAAKLETTQTQLETLFALTARLSRLSLVDFLR